MGFSGSTDGKECVCDAGYPGLIPGSGIHPGEGNGNPLWYSCLENSMDRGTWWVTVHGVTKSQLWLSGYFHFQKLKESTIFKNIILFSNVPRIAFVIADQVVRLQLTALLVSCQQAPAEVPRLLDGKWRYLPKILSAPLKINTYF